MKVISLTTIAIRNVSNPVQPWLNLICASKSYFQVKHHIASRAKQTKHKSMIVPGLNIFMNKTKNAMSNQLIFPFFCCCSEAALLFFLCFIFLRTFYCQPVIMSYLWCFPSFFLANQRTTDKAAISFFDPPKVDDGICK